MTIERNVSMWLLAAVGAVVVFFLMLAIAFT